ncbi:MAG TPA: Maf family protein [Ignavibacteria bacterium]|nr:septum formation protein Maf [Ignavibacteria bacterium]HAX48862.1 septum formation protein Maf [Bacteroidota bacterium]HRE11533.1 Maf family protein [Ignavibacteria bacterium]HRF66622.1 Maf family protein [Ignavibacteria bacterium]HRJ04476.1 Maf family protein [Ignavibacteria bacterium]
MVTKKLKNKRIILASGSPRRKLLLSALLKNFGLKFDVIQANIVEYIPEKVQNYGNFAANLAELKALEVACRKNGIIIAADTIVVYQGKVLGKPVNEKDAFKMLKTLSGNEHKVYTGLVIFDTESESMYKTFEVTKVKFRKIADREIKFYIKGGSPMDKAGSYGIQDDLGSTFVQKINGDYFNVVGLPLFRLYEGLSKFVKLMN